MAILGRREAELEETSRLADAAYHGTCDVSDPAAVHRFFSDVVAKLGRVDVVFNNAGRFAPQASFGDIGAAGTPMLITSPTVRLDAFGDTLTPNTGHAFATLTGTNSLELIAENGFNVSSDTALDNVSIETLGSGTGTPGASTLNLTAPGQTYTFDRPAADLFGPVTNTFQVVSVSGPTTARCTRWTIECDRASPIISIDTSSTSRASSPACRDGAPRPTRAHTSR